MKKFLFSISAGVFCCLSSCKEDHAAADKNLTAAHEIVKAIESGDVSKLGDYMATDAVDHAGEHGDVKGLDSIKAHLGAMHTMITDMKMETKKELADADYVFQWVRFTGTCAVGMGPAMPPGTKMDMTSVEVSRFQDGKAVEHWGYMDMQDAMKMSAPPMGNMEGKMDTKMDASMSKDTLKK